MSDRNLTTPTKQVFGDVQKGTECRICARTVDDGRSKYCSDYCRNLAKAVMGMLNWSSVRRRVTDRDDETCQRCGFDYSKERHARRHIRNRIDELLPDRPDGPSARELGAGEADDFDWEAHNERVDEWREEKERIEERYGDPYEHDGGLEVDHVTPISEGGHPFDPGNLQTLCNDCHKDKTAAEASERADRRTPSREDINESLFEYASDGGQEEPVPEFDPEVDWMNEHHTWCSTCGDYFGNQLYEEEHADHDIE